MSGSGLTVFEHRFVQEYLADPRSRVKAYKKIDPLCTYDTARVESRKLCRKPAVLAEITAGLKALDVSTRVTAVKVRKALARVAFADPVDLFDVDDGEVVLRPMHRVPAALRQAIAGVKVKRVAKKVKRDDAAGTTTTTTVDIVEVKLNNRVAAQAQLARILGMYLKDNQQKHSPAEVQAAEERLRQRLGDEVFDRLQGKGSLN